MKKPKDPEKKCVHCDKPCTDENFCHGCRHYICEDPKCETGNAPFGAHKPDAHQREPIDFDEER